MKEQEIGAALGADRSRWRRVKFGQMAQHIGDRVDNPSEAGVERYVGLEHLDPETLAIRRWGLPTDVESTKLRFQVGDVIFGKRRAYQRKSAVADFEGICSAHAMVLRAREEAVDPHFLPVFMQTDLFMERAVNISVGSLSPTINWRTLAEQEFDLPPLDEQQRIAEVLWAVEESTGELTSCLQDAKALIFATLSDCLAEAERKIADRHRDWQWIECERLFENQPKNGISPSSQDDAVIKNSLSIGCVQNGVVVTEGHTKSAKFDAAQAPRFPVRKGDILIVRGNGNKNLTGLAGIAKAELSDYVYPDLLIRVTFNEHLILTAFALSQWNFAGIHKKLLMRAKSSNGIWKINGKDLREHQLLVPPLSVQAELVTKLQQIEDAQKQTAVQIARLKTLKRSLSRALLG